MSELNDDIMRGCLPSGESIEARWGTGWWSIEPYQEQEQDYFEEQCVKCLGSAHYHGYDIRNCQFVDCENNCTADDVNEILRNARRSDE